MNKLSDLLDDLRLNLSVAAGSLVLLTGFLTGWNEVQLWQIALSGYGALIAIWLLARFLRICNAGIVVENFGYGEPDVLRPGPAANSLKEFLQPLALAFFAALLGLNWSDTGIGPVWFTIFLILFYLLFVGINLHYYKRCRRE